MTLTIERQKETRAPKSRRDIFRRSEKGTDSAREVLSPAEMLEILNRHERAIIEAAKKAGLPSGFEYGK